MLQISEHHTSQFPTVSNNKMADTQHCDAGSILVALNLVLKCGVILHLQKNVLFFVGAGAMQILAFGLIPVTNEPLEPGM